MRLNFAFLAVLFFSGLQLGTSQARLSLQNNGDNCFTMLLANESAQDVKLHGQNYRLYYDAELTSFLAGSLESLLPTPNYSPAVLKQDVQDVDASGFGVLEFENHLGFINFYIDYKNAIGGAMDIAAGHSLPIAEFCFAGETVEASEIIWAQEAITGTYATAFNVVKLVDGETNEKVDFSLDFYSESTVDVEEPEIAELDLSYYPNPFMENLTIEFNRPLASDALVTVTDVFGQEISRQSLSQGTEVLTVDGNALAPGAYFIQVSTESGYSRELKALRLK